MTSTSSSSQSSDSRFQRSEAHLRRRDANISRRMSQQHLLDQAETAEQSFSQRASQRDPEAHNVYRSLSAVCEEMEEEAQYTSLSAGPGGVVLPSDAAIDFFASLEHYKLKPGDPPLTDAQAAEKHADVAKYVDQVAEVRSNPSLEYAVLKALDDQAGEGQADSPHGLWYQMASECHKSIRTMKLEISKRDAAEAAAGAAAAAAEGAYNAGEICTICQDRLPTDASLQTVTACRHAFCADCLDAWKQAGGHRCPNCNQGLGNDRPLPGSEDRPARVYGFGVTADTFNGVDMAAPFAPGSLADPRNQFRADYPRFRPALGEEEEEPQFRPALGEEEEEEPQFRPALSDEVSPPFYPSLGRTSAAELARAMDAPVEWPRGITRSLYGVPEVPDPNMPPGYRYLATHPEDEEPSFAGTVVYRGAVFRSAIATEDDVPMFTTAIGSAEDDEPVFVSCGASCGADEPSAKRVCA